MATTAATYGNWLKTMQGAQATLQGEANIYAPGGSYGAGQDAIIQNQSQKAQASALSNLVSTGMSSGTNALGAKARISADATKARLSVADERSKMYANVLTQLAGLKQNMAGGMQGWAQLNQDKTLATDKMDLEKWLTTTNNALKMNQQTSAQNAAQNAQTQAFLGFGVPNTVGDNIWGQSSGVEPTGMSPNV